MPVFEMIATSLIAKIGIFPMFFFDVGFLSKFGGPKYILARQSTLVKCLLSTQKSFLRALFH